MTTKPSFWQRIGLQDWFLNNTGSSSPGHKKLTPNSLYQCIIDGFKKSIEELSFAERTVFYHEFIVCLNVDDYQEFMDQKKGLLGLIAHESVPSFYKILNSEIKAGKRVEPTSNKWVFRFVSHPDYRSGDIGFIGKLFPESAQQEENLRVTFIPRQTGLAQTFDVNHELLKDFVYYSDGYYEIPYSSVSLEKPDKPAKETPNAVLARLETTIPDRAFAGKKLEYLMKAEEITVSGDEDAGTSANVFRIPSEWVNTPHLRIRYSRSREKFEMASFGEKTILNETWIEQSSPSDVKWIELPLNSRMILNGIIGINIFRP